MPLPRDPDVLRVPAFMRKRNLRLRAARPLVLTALDRKKISTPRRTPKKIQRKIRGSFAAPLLNATPLPATKKSKNAGTLTHYYDKIKVGVIRLAGTLSVGDCIEYETDEGPYRQIVESLEINREPVFKAGRGKEVGLKLARIPRAGSPIVLV